MDTLPYPYYPTGFDSNTQRAVSGEFIVGDDDSCKDVAEGLQVRWA